MYDTNPPKYTEAAEPIQYHPYFWFSDDMATFQVGNTRFRVHKHFLFTNSSVFRGIFREQSRQSGSYSTRVNERLEDDNSNAIHLNGVSVPEFESLLTFFYESWRDSFSMPLDKWVALLAITHRFKFTEAEFRARREVFKSTESRILGPVKKISLATLHSVPISFIVPSLEKLVRREMPLDEAEIVNLPSEMVARIGVAREKYVTRKLTKVFTSETWFKQVAHDIVMSVWNIEDGASDGD